MVGRAHLKFVQYVTETEKMHTMVILDLQRCDFSEKVKQLKVFFILKTNG